MTFSQVTTTCPYCATGCSLNLLISDGRVTGTGPYFRSPVNEGRICPKGTYCHQFIHNPDRLKKPLIRKGDIFYEADWDAALDLIARRIKEFAPEKIAILSSARCSNEDNYLAMKFARGVIRTRNIDHCARLCHAATMTGLTGSFGTSAMTNSIPDIGDSDCIFCLGSNTLEQHPLVGRQIIRARTRGARLIYADPRYTPTAIQSDMFIQFYHGSDVLLLNSIMGEIIRNGHEDINFINERTAQYEDLRKVVLQKRYEPEIAAKLCGVAPQTIKTTAEWIGIAERCTVLYAMGITRDSAGVDNVRSIANLMMLTGNMGRPGTGVNALRGQNNVQGACDVGCLPQFLPGYARAGDIAAHMHLARMWDFPNGICEPGEGTNINELFEGTTGRNIQAMYLIGENPVVSEPNPKKVREIVQKLSFLVVQDIFFTETCQYAHVVLPAACWAEKDGTQTNTERRVQRIRKAVDAPGQARPDHVIITQLAAKMGFADQFEYKNAREVFDEICTVVNGYQGMDWDRVGKPGGVCWPCPSSDHPGTPILYTTEFATPNGKGVFYPVEWKEPAEMPDTRYPFRLTMGRLIWHWQSGSMTRRCKNLTDEVNEAYLEINPSDAQTLGIRDNDKIKVHFRKGTILLNARLVRDIKKGSTFMPLHFIDQAASGSNTDSTTFVRLTEYKSTTIRIEKIKDAEL